MISGLQVLEALLICSATLYLWKSFRYLVVKTDLDNLPGPPSPSFFAGMWRVGVDWTLVLKFSLRTYRKSQGPGRVGIP